MMRGDRFFREIGDNTWDPARRIEECDRTGVAVQVLSTVPVMFSYWAKPADGLDLSRRLNDHIAEVVRAHPTRFAGLGTIPLQDPDLAAGELERCVRELGLRGVEIGTHVDANEFCDQKDCRNLDDRSLDAVWSAAEEMGAAIFVHPWDMLGKNAHAEILAAVAGRDAGRNFAGHLLDDLRWGFRAVSEICGSLSRMVAAPSRSRLVASSTALTSARIWSRSKTRSTRAAIWRGSTSRARTQPARFYVDSLVHDPEALRLLVKLFGTQRIALGSDYPFPLGEAHPGELIESMADLSSDDKARLLAGTAREFLGLP